MGRAIGTISLIAEWLIKILSILFICGMIAIIIWQVATRWLPITVPTWTEEASRFLMVFMACIGGILAMNAADGFVRVDILTNALPPRAAMIVDIMGRLLVMALLILIFQPALDLIAVRGRQVSPSLQLSMAIPQSAILVWIIGALIVGVKNIINRVRLFRTESASDELEIETI